MATGTYGTIRNSDISINDIDSFYTYSPSREVNSNEIIRLQTSDILEELVLPNGDNLEVISDETILEGLYNLKLPSNIFNEIGIYTIFLTPKKYKLSIVDCGVLSSLPTVKGLILNVNDLPTELTLNNALQGYRIEYFNSDGTKIRNTSRFIVTSNKVTPVTENVGNTSQTTLRYRFDDSGTLLFLQLTPSSASNIKPNVTPFIGFINQTIHLCNTSMNPISIEVEMVKNDIDTVMDIVGGEQIRDVDQGLLTHYTTDLDGNKQILKQFNLFEIKDDVGNVSLFEVKQERVDNIDETQDFDDIISSVS